jgi:hypothetical protein
MYIYTHTAIAKEWPAHTCMYVSYVIDVPS